MVENQFESNVFEEQILRRANDGGEAFFLRFCHGFGTGEKHSNAGSEAEWPQTWNWPECLGAGD
jgi:hypothetical protein